MRPGPRRPRTRVISPRDGRRLGPDSEIDHERRRLRQLHIRAARSEEGALAVIGVALLQEPDIEVRADADPALIPLPRIDLAGVGRGADREVSRNLQGLQSRDAVEIGRRSDVLVGRIANLGQLL
jgi:hypothetical protein